MKRMLFIVMILFVLLCGCSQNQAIKEPKSFTVSGNGNVVSDSGDEYTRIANEGFLCYMGELEFLGSVEGEAEISQHLMDSYQTGMYAIKQDDIHDVLIRYEPNNEWFRVYRRASLPACDFSLDNCIRLEYVPGNGYFEDNFVHTTCGEGMTDPDEIAAFLNDVRSQKSPLEAGLYDLVKKPDGFLENCYVCGVIYGFFAEEPNVAIRMNVTSYNDLAYSVSIENAQYVLPEAWLQALRNE